jgi:hypothetical protein
LVCPQNKLQLDNLTHCGKAGVSENRLPGMLALTEQFYAVPSSNVPRKQDPTPISASFQIPNFPEGVVLDVGLCTDLALVK